MFTNKVVHCVLLSSFIKEMSDNDAKEISQNTLEFRGDHKYPM